ncbi:MAG: 6-hydroxymethylpterin diphosphokinase MptE-like protein [Eubacteriales bacterium]
MSLSSLIEKWDNIVFVIYNTIARVLYILKYPKVYRYLKKNKKLKGIHKGQRCFIVLNGPSLNNYDLSKINNEFSICTNYFYQTDFFNVINPKYYCIIDSNFFNIKKNLEQKEHVKKILKSNKDCKFIFNIKFIESFENEDRVYVTYSKHMPNFFKIRNRLESISSNFISVSMYAMNVAIYLGFTEIYLLGYDFEPGILSHFYKDNNAEKKSKERQNLEVKKEEVCAKYWQYATAQYQNYYLNDFANKKGVKIFNCNRQSNVRAFEFFDYEKLFTENK